MICSNRPLTDAVAIIGMAGRFPGATDVDAFWSNIRDGVESLTLFSDGDLDPSVPESLRRNPDYVAAAGALPDVDKFDAEFFGIARREAEVIDPQQRVFLELAWEAIETAGYDPARFPGLIGVYAGMKSPTYLVANLLSRPDVLSTLGERQVRLANAADYLAARVAYKLDLTGPTITLGTACSTSLVAVCYGFQGLISHQCDMALAGGVSIAFPLNVGHLHQEGGIGSIDGRCRPFDADASGTVFGNGAGIVVLRRLEDALDAGDTIVAVIRGAATTNDGARKGSFTAPGVEGQARTISLALAQADVPADTVSYVEAHGTATPIGDPIEIHALTEAFGPTPNPVTIGSVKGNIGHLDAAAGIAGLIKTARALDAKELPPSLHFHRPNPNIDFENSPFHVSTMLKEWPVGPTPRRAGVSSFGLGGTNAHVVLEEAQQREPSGRSRPAQLLLLSARTDSALAAATENLREFLQRQDRPSLPDTAFTLQCGRRSFQHRRAIVCSDAHDAIEALASPDGGRIKTRRCDYDDPPVAFMFPGQGAQYVNMGKTLHAQEPVFRRAVDHCAEILQPVLQRDLREVLYVADGQAEEGSSELNRTEFTQPALFTTCYSLARLWEDWGVRPRAMIGHSVGEFVAACLAGVMSLEDALFLVGVRGRMMSDLPMGGMLSIRLPAEEIEALLTPRLSIAALNGPSLTTVAGPSSDIETLREELERAGVAHRPLHTSHAFHSPMMEPMLEPFAEEVRSVALSPPETPFVSTVTGSWITENEATDPGYWARHLREPVRFAAAVKTLLSEPGRVLVEVGPRATATVLARQQLEHGSPQLVVPSLTDTAENDREWTALLGAIGQLWLSGVSLDWGRFYELEKRRRVPVPTYPFERQRYWVTPRHPSALDRPEVASWRANDEPTSTPAGRELDGDRDRSESELARRLRDLVSETAGLDLSRAEESLTFLELGLESLFLTQLSVMIEDRFGVRVPFRQLLEDVSTIGSLARFIASDRATSEPGPLANHARTPAEPV